MIKKYYVLAIVALLMIPVVLVVGASISIVIDPEIARGHDNYERNFRLISQLKTALFMATLVVDLGLWVVACFFLLKSKSQSYWWLPLCAFGPLGLIALTIIRDKAPLPGDLYQRFIQGMKAIWRVAYEVGLFLFVWFGSFSCVVLIREIQISAESYFTGTPRAEIVAVQLASSGMWAFTEGLEALGLVVLFYLTFPVLFNVAGRLLSFKPAT